MHVYLFFVGIACSALMSEAKSKTNTYNANGVTLDVEKSEALEKGEMYGLGDLKYIVRSMENGFQIEFSTSKSNLSLDKLNGATIRVSPVSRNKPNKNTYLDISIRNRQIQSFSIIDYFLIGSWRKPTSLLSIIVGPDLDKPVGSLLNKRTQI